jgi:hypothetical protein
MAKITASKKFCNLAIIACAIHRFNDDGHNWKSDHTEDPTKVAGKAVAVAGSDKQEFIEFMSRNGHDIWHYLSDKCLTRLAYILTTDMDYGKNLASLPSSELAMVERYGIELDFDAVAVEARVNLSQLTVNMPDIVPQADEEADADNEEEEGADEDDQGPEQGGADDGDDGFQPMPSDQDTEQGGNDDTALGGNDDGDEGDDDEDDDDDDDQTPIQGPVAAADKTVKLTELIVVGQAAKDRFPPGTMGKSAMITGVALAMAMLEHICRRVTVPHSSEITSSLALSSAALAGTNIERTRLVAAKEIMSHPLAMAWGYCRELTELEPLANNYQSIINFAQRYPVAVASGATLARMMKEVVADPKAVENAIVGAFQVMSSMQSNLGTVLGLTSDPPQFPREGDIEIFRTTAQLSNEKERRSLEVELETMGED